MESNGIEIGFIRWFILQYLCDGSIMYELLH